MIGSLSDQKGQPQKADKPEFCPGRFWDNLPQIIELSTNTSTGKTPIDYTLKITEMVKNEVYTWVTFTSGL